MKHRLMRRYARWLEDDIVLIFSPAIIPYLVACYIFPDFGRWVLPHKIAVSTTTEMRP
jgi:hypothetical protein